MRLKASLELACRRLCGCQCEVVRGLHSSRPAAPLLARRSRPLFQPVCSRANFSTRFKLAEVGRFETPQSSTETYPPCKAFLHKVFGYRGIVLANFQATVYDRELNPALKTAQRDGSYGLPREVQGVPQNYYLVLVDSRDWQFIRSQIQMVTFLPRDERNKGLYNLPGMDYVSHEDIMPYTPAESVPILHELYDRFVMPASEDGTSLGLRETCRAWLERNKSWLEVADVHKETTADVRVTAIPFYMGVRAADERGGGQVYWWRYAIRIENLSGEELVLRERHWRVFSLSGTLETVKGKGVVGQEPLFNKDTPAFQYSSHICLHSPSGHMWGEFTMENRQGQLLKCKIPSFLLEAAPDDPPAEPVH